MSTELHGFTGTPRAAVPVPPGPSAFLSLQSPRAARATTLRGMAIALVAAAAVFGAFSVAPHTSAHPAGSLSSGTVHQQQQYVNEHLLGPSSMFFEAVPAPAWALPFAGRVLL